MVVTRLTPITNGSEVPARRYRNVMIWPQVRSSSGEYMVGLVPTGIFVSVVQLTVSA